MNFKNSMDSSFLDFHLSPAETDRLKERIINLNPKQDFQKLFGAKYWDISRFGRENLPVVVGSLEDAESFDSQNGIRVLDMPLYMPGQGWRIPAEFLQFRELFFKIAEHEKVINPFFDDCYAYITIDQKAVVPDVSQRRPGWHSDAFITDEAGVQVDVTAENRKHILRQEEMRRRIDYTYVAYSTLPTWFLPGPFSLEDCDPNNCDEVLATFDEIAEGKTPVTYPPFTILRLDPYDIHTSAPNMTGETIARTFIKMAFSSERYNREGNTTNPLFDYEWDMVPRKTGKREHRYVKTDRY